MTYTISTRDWSKKQILDSGQRSPWYVSARGEQWKDARVYGVNCSSSVASRTNLHYPYPWDLSARKTSNADCMSRVVGPIEIDFNERNEVRLIHKILSTFWNKSKSFITSLTKSQWIVEIIGRQVIDLDNMIAKACQKALMSYIFYLHGIWDSFNMDLRVDNVHLKRSLRLPTYLWPSLLCVCKRLSHNKAMSSMTAELIRSIQAEHEPPKARNRSFKEEIRHHQKGSQSHPHTEHLVAWRQRRVHQQDHGVARHPRSSRMEGEERTSPRILIPGQRGDLSNEEDDCHQCSILVTLNGPVRRRWGALTAVEDITDASASPARAQEMRRLQRSTPNGRQKCKGRATNSSSQRVRPIFE